jgi:hypothetical protein
MFLKHFVGLPDFWLQSIESIKPRLVNFQKTILLLHYLIQK